MMSLIYCLRLQTYGVEYEDCPSSLICDGDEPGLCEKVQYEFTGDLPDEINSYGFDNFRNAIMTIFIATTLDEWPQISDPIRGAPLMAAWTAWGFFALVVLICGMLGTNLFVAVISFAFANVAETEDGTSAFAKGTRRTLRGSSLARARPSCRQMSFR